jgi:two-component system LytT family response regulator
MLTAIIIDDEQNGRIALRQKLQDYCADVELIGEAENGEDGMKLIEKQQPDVVFLDIEMPRMDGFEMLHRLPEKNFHLIFTTAYDQYAIKAIKYAAFDYLLKPIEIEELQQAVKRIGEKKLNKSSSNQLELLLENMLPKKSSYQRIAIPTSEGLQFIKLNEIVYLEANNNYTYFHLAGNQKYIVSRTLKDFEEMLPDETFLRIHNSYIINKNFAERYIRGEGGQVVLSNGTVLDVAKRKKADFLKAIGL